MSRHSEYNAHNGLSHSARVMPLRAIQRQRVARRAPYVRFINGVLRWCVLCAFLSLSAVLAAKLLLG